MIERMWINQPSTLQPLHHLHGTLVLADEQNRVYFLSGDVISQQAPHGALSKGWPRHLCTVREVAPAEAGDTLHPDAQPFEQYPELALHIERMAISGVVGSMISWDAFLRELNAALRAQPPAREDAQPVAWFGDKNYEPTEAMIDAGLHHNHRSNSEANMISSFKEMMMQAEIDGLVSYTHPASDALRRAVEALEKIKAVRVCKESANIWTGADACRKIATEALTALQGAK